MKAKLTHRICKDESGKFYVDFYNDDCLFATGKNGELSLILENEDRSERCTLENWKADEAHEGADAVTLYSRCYIEKLTTFLEITVTYKKVNESCYEKLVHFKQTNIPVLFFSVKTSLCGEECAHLWSFDNCNHAGGIVHGTYPAIGFTNKNGISGGLLTDAGHRNLWTRNLRRRPTPGNIGFTAMERLCDGQMLRLENDTATLQLGMLHDYKHGERVGIPITYEVDYRAMAGSVVVGGDFIGAGKYGGYVPYRLEDGYYTLCFDCKSDAPACVRILKQSPESEVRAFHYQDFLREATSEWAHFSGTFFLSDTENEDTLLHFFAQDSSDASGTLSIKNISLTRHEGEEVPYHSLRIGHEESRRMFIFAAEGDDIRTLRLASQTYLADGLAFEGTVPEKVLFADMQMLTWITSEADFTPLNVPSINYAPDMYNRDCFWSVAGINDAALSIALFERWGDTQTDKGGIGTIVTPCMGSIEVKDNEASCEWMWWAYINRTKYGSEASREKLQKAWQYCEEIFDSERSGICRSHFVMGQNDVCTYPGDKKTSDISVNQGIWAVTLKVAKALGFPVEQARIDAAIGAYRDFYDAQRGYILNDRLYPHSISAGDLLPEFVSLWLFDEPMLTDEMVINTLERIPHENEFGFFIGHADNRYFSKENIPCDSEFMWPDGVYYNGASWMREEVIGYAAGARHGWKQAKERFTKRLEGEINVKSDEPFSHEFIPTDLSVSGCWWPSTRVFCWNTFALTAKTVGGF